MEAGSERPLENPPQDGISSLAFSPSSSNLLLVSSWDKTARLYDGTSNVAKGIWRNHAAVLDCAVQDDQTGFSGGLDRAVRMYVRREWA
jgi:cell cycle arrest protein BUB3